MDFLSKKIKDFIGDAGSFRQNALIMSGGASLNVLLSLGLYPVVTRMYTKEHFGGFGLFIAVVSIISLLGTSLYPTGLVIPKFKREFYAMLKLSLFLAILTVIIVSFIIIAFKDAFITVFQLDEVAYVLPLIPIGIGLTCMRDIAVNWNVRNKDFKKNATSNVVSSGGLKTINIGYALTLGTSTLALVISQIISILLSISTLGVGRMFSELKTLSRIKWHEVKDVALKYNKYPKHLLPGNLVNRYTSDLPIYLLTAYFSPAITGAFVLANSVMNIPLNVLGNSIASVFLQRANELYIDDKEKLKNFARATNRKLVLAGVMTFGILFGFGDIIFEIVFGDEWLLAGQMAMILSVYFIFKLAAGPMAKVFRVVGKEEYSLYASVVLGVCRSIGVVLGVLTSNALNTIIYFSFGSILGYLFTYMLVFRSCGISMFHSLIHMMKYVILGLGISWALRLTLDF